jgi:hypothetical protein
MDYFSKAQLLSEQIVDYQRMLNPDYIGAQLASYAGGFSNSQGLPLPLSEIFSFSDMLQLEQVLAGPKNDLKGKINEILVSTSNIQDKGQRAAAEKENRKIISQLIEKTFQKILTTLKRNIDHKAARVNEQSIRVKDDQMFASTLSSADREDDEKTYARNQISDSYLIRPGDPSSMSINA